MINLQRSPVVNLPSQNVAFGIQGEKWKREERKGQRVANPNRGGRRPAADDEDEDGAAGEEPSTSGRGEEETDHERRVRRKEEAWAAQRVEMTSEVYASARTQQEQQQQQGARQVDQLQDRLDNSWVELEHAHGCTCTKPDELCRRKLHYHSIACAGFITVPTWRCPGCLAISTPHAIPYGCFATSPEVAAAWLEIRLLDLYGAFGPVAGLSAKGKLLR